MKIIVITSLTASFYTIQLIAQDFLRSSPAQTIPNIGGNDICLADFNNDKLFMPGSSIINYKTPDNLSGVFFFSSIYLFTKITQIIDDNC